RLRKALDSDRARLVMDQYFQGNRIFIGRYTSLTPVTGFHKHPRPDADEHERRAGKLEKLFEAMVNMDVMQRAARGPGNDPEARFLFPSVDGAEEPSRWDMQEHPPDVLITNISMLSAMLSREVDSPLFEKTRAWLNSDPNAYFFLVFDELHLH